MLDLSMGNEAIFTNPICIPLSNWCTGLASEKFPPLHQAENIVEVSQKLVCEK